MWVNVVLFFSVVGFGAFTGFHLSGGKLTGAIGGGFLAGCIILLPWGRSPKNPPPF